MGDFIFRQVKGVIGKKQPAPVFVRYPQRITFAQIPECLVVLEFFFGRLSQMEFVQMFFDPGRLAVQNFFYFPLGNLFWRTHS
jgi:hypothetical protein